MEVGLLLATRKKSGGGALPLLNATPRANMRLQLLLTLALGSFGASSAADTCSAAPETLTATCGGLCSEYEPCLTYNVSESCSGCAVNASDPCQYQCLQTQGENASGGSGVLYSILLVAFGEYQSEEEIAERAANPNFNATLALLPDNRTDYAWVSNDLLTTVDPPELDGNTAYYCIAGGNTFDYVMKSKVVKLELADNLLTTQTQLIDIRFMSINLKDQIDGITNLLPSSVSSLSLENTLLKSFPTHLSTLTNLEELYLGSNYIDSVSASEGIEQLLVLSLRTNEMTSFEGNFPYLTALDLAYNNFTSIPDVIFNFTNLQKLYLTGNQLETPTFTSAQADFLTGLTDFDLTAADFQHQVSCDTSARRRVHSITVCISEAASSSSGSSSATTESGDSSSSSTVVIVVVIVVGVIVVVGIIAGVCCWRKRQNGKGKAEETNATIPSSHLSTHKSSIVTSIWTDPDLLSVQVQLNEIQDIRLIGSGAFCLVYLVRYRNSQLLASKRLRVEIANHQRIQDFIAEIKLVSTLDHPNIVKFVGAAWSIEADLQALFEFMENGDLRTFLSASNMPRYWTKAKFQLAIDVVEALVYVHSFQPPLVHRDLKSRNILISGDMHAKLTDFGVSRYQSEDNTMTMGVGTSRWLAPEVISGASNYGPAADIFSFGVVITELDTHAIPYEGVMGANGNPLPEVALLQMVASGQLRPTISRSCPSTILELAQLCMSQEPSERPTAAEIAFVLRSVQKEMFSH